MKKIKICPKRWENTNAFRLDKYLADLPRNLAELNVKSPQPVQHPCDFSEIRCIGDRI